MVERMRVQHAGSATGVEVVYGRDYDALERENKELRTWRVQASDCISRLTLERENLEAENARLRALPLKDEVERVLEDSEQRFIAIAIQIDNLSFSLAKGVCSQGEIAARALLSRLRAGEREGWRLVPEDPDLAEHLIRAALVAGYKGVGSTDEEAGTLADAKMADPKELAFCKAQYAGMLAAAPSELGGDRG